MSQHQAQISWKREGEGFDYETFNRDHLITYPGGISFKASSAPEYKGNAALTNPEEMFAAAVASCHMLTFLAIAAKSRVVVEEYEDQPVATLAQNAEGEMAITKVDLSPRVRFQDPQGVSAEKLEKLHEKAHRNCFIANSVKCEVNVHPPEGIE